MACIADFYIIDNQVIKTDQFDITFLEKGFTIYEVVKIIKATPLFIDDHIKRLHNSAKLKHEKVLYDDAFINDKVNELIQINNIIKGRLKFGIRYHSSGNKFISFFLENIEPPKHVYNKGVKIISENHERKSPNAKVINYLLRKRVRSIISDTNIFETLLVNKNGKITECSKSNIFFIKGNTIYTSNSKDVLLGITRMYVFKICNDLNISIVEKDIYYSELNNFNSAFISGTSIGILSMIKIDTISFERKNNILRKISEAYNKLTEKYIELHNSYETIKTSSSTKK